MTRSAALRPTLLMALLGAVLLAICLLSLSLGARSIPPIEVARTLLGHPPDQDVHDIVWSARVPRTALGLTAGAALGLSGALMQALTRNPLADPGILGVNAGAALFVVIAITLGITGALGYVWFAFLGAALASVVVYSIASLGRDGATPVKLALAGAAISALCYAVTTAFLLLDQSTFDQFRFWQVGALAGRGLGVVGQLAPFLALGILVSLLLGRVLNTLSLGDDVARGLGASVLGSRIAAAAVVVLLCGAATAAAGPIGFVGLTIPHVARMITGPDYRWVLPYSMLLSPILLLGADILGRVVARPGEVQVAIVTALIGAPVFIALVRRRNLAEL